MNRPVAIVIAWFGRDLKGGAEQLAYQVATRLAARGHLIEVLTTCSRSFLDDWGVNHLRPGKERDTGVVIRRFPVDRRDSAAFVAANDFVLSIAKKDLIPGVSPFTCGTADTFVHENIRSRALLKYLKKHHRDYHAFLFLPYLYGPVLNGLPLVADRAWLQPCLHDEAYAYHPRVEELFRIARGILYNSAGEALLARRLYGPGIVSRDTVVGVGVESVGLPAGELPVRVGSLTMGRERFILCLGRRDVLKNTLFLAETFAAYAEKHPDSDLKLALAGPGDTTFDHIHPRVLDLGLVSEKEKEALLTHCLALFQPSENESYSRVMMETWFHDHPVVAHRRCLATAVAVQEAGGGWLAGEKQEWLARIEEVDKASPAELAVLGRQGHAYAERFAVWDRVIDRYEEVLGLKETVKSSQVTVRRLPVKEINQLLAGFAAGDAISNQALLIRDHLRGMGYDSEIYTEQIAPEMAGEAKLVAKSKIPLDQGLLYHHSIGNGLLDLLAALTGPRALIYHNITPPELVGEHHPELARLLNQGLSDLPRLARIFPLAAGVSRFNCSELARYGVSDPELLPLVIDPDRWNVPAPPALMYELQDGRTNILFVGRVVGNKCQHDLIRGFSLYRTFNPHSRLILVGGYDPEDQYYHVLEQLVQELGLQGDVFFAGKVDDHHLHAYYRTAHLYWSMSEHEGFGVPLIEAMWFDVPVLAYGSSAIPETLGEAGLIFTDKDNLEQVAALAHVLLSHDAIHRQVLACQQKRCRDFLPGRVLPALDRLLDRMTVSG